MNKIILFIALVFLYSCSSQQIFEDPAAHQDEIQSLENKIDFDSSNSNAIKDLALILVRTKQSAKAESVLLKALERFPGDPELIFHLGLNYELLNDKARALEYYKQYPAVPSDSPYKELMYGRYLYLSREVAYAEIKEMVKQEQSISQTKLSKDTLAVFPLKYLGPQDNYSPLGRGFSEMISMDLAKVDKLTVLERVRLQAIMDELKLGQSPQMDESTAPRTGKILRAGLVYSGSYNVSEDGQLKVDIGSWEVETGSESEWVSKSDDVHYLFQLEKDLVFRIIQDLEIELTSEERQQIEYIPTENIEAFLAFSRGLISEDGGMFGEAASHYQEAVNIDPQFNTARIKLESVSTLNLGSGSTEQFLGVSLGFQPETEPGKNELVGSRITNLSNAIRSNFLPGVDNRKGAQEESNAEDLGTLPSPPPPPGR
ncbi:MAG: CsgG/HfaB family protein [bacterium]